MPHAAPWSLHNCGACSATSLLHLRMGICRTYGSTVVNQLCTAVVCPSQVDTLAPSYWTEAKRCWLCAQTLADIGVIDTMAGEDGYGEDDVQSAKVKALLCPALLELVCEALESSGTEPERLQACQTLGDANHASALANA